MFMLNSNEPIKVVHLKKLANQSIFEQRNCDRKQFIQSAFTCNRDEISSPNETRPGIKKFLFTREFHPGMKFHLKESLSLSMKTY